MTQGKYIGGLEEAVMIAINGLGSDAYGVSVHEALRHANRNISIGSLYVTLGRLEDKGYIASKDGDPTAERGGRAKRYFNLTGAGVKVLDDAENTRTTLKGIKGTVSWGI